MSEVGRRYGVLQTYSNAVQLRRGTADEWAGINPVLKPGEVGVDTSTSPQRIKIGDGVTAWNDLGYSGGSEIPASTFTYFTDGAGGYDIVGGPYVEHSARIFIGPDDPEGAGFTMTDGDQWEVTD